MSLNAISSFFSSLRYTKAGRLSLPTLSLALLGCLLALSCKYTPPAAPPQQASNAAPETAASTPTAPPDSMPLMPSRTPQSAASAPGSHDITGLPPAAPPGGVNIAQLQERLRLNPDDTDARIRLSIALDSRGQASEAEDVLRFALQRGQKKPEIYHALGMVYLRNGIYAGAVESFKYEVRLNPKSFAGHLNLGQAYSYSNKPQEALKAFETARKLDPTVADTYLGLAFLNNTSERYPFAVQYLREYIQRSKQPGPGYAMLSRVYLNQREFDKAVEAGRKAVEAMPDSGSSWYNLGQAYSYRPGDTYLKEAAAAFEKANQLVPNWGGAHFELGRIYERMGRKDEALAQYREATRSAPTIGKFRYQLGRLLIQLGQTEEGRRTVAEAEETLRLNQREEQLVNKIAAFPKESRYLYELGQVYKELGETQKALSSFQAALDLQPNNAQYRAAMQEMRSRLPLR